MARQVVDEVDAGELPDELVGGEVLDDLDGDGACWVIMLKLHKRLLWYSALTAPPPAHPAAVGVPPDSSDDESDGEGGAHVGASGDHAMVDDDSIHAFEGHTGELGWFFSTVGPSRAAQRNG